MITKWTLKLVQQLEKSSNKIIHLVDHWIDSVLGGFVTEFAIDQFVSYSEVERRFFKGLRGKFLHSLKLWIKMILCEQGTLCNHIE